MKTDILLGLQWGDEGKGKIVDFFAEKYDVIARFQGGPNAGHSLEFNNIKHVLHIIPSGIFHPEKVNIIGNGVVIDPIVFLKEISQLEQFKFDPRERLFISRKAHLILPTHRLLDAANEKAKGKDKIGSTLKGIGPAYMDKTGRNGLRVGDIETPNFDEKLNNIIKKHETLLSHFDYEYNLDEAMDGFNQAIETLKSFTLIDSEYEVNKYLNQGKKVLAEGAQGTLLDIDFGSYPFVTSSNTVAAGACIGLGIAPQKIGEVFGVFKAYCTRVGSGPFPTEQSGNTGENLQKYGHEYGSTTGRPRRCGWLDLVALKYAVTINGVTQLIMTKSDVLDNFDKLYLATEYEIDGKKSDRLPFDINIEPQPILKEFNGWNSDTTKTDNYENLPTELKEYIKFIEDYIKVPVSIVSVGPDREQTIIR